jgi:hypothetical protein
VSVGRVRRAAVAVPGLARAWAARRSLPAALPAPSP